MSEWSSFQKMLGDSAFDGSITPDAGNKDDSDVEVTEPKRRSRSSSSSSSASSKSRSSSSGSSGSSRSNSPEKEAKAKKRSRSKSPEEAPHRKVAAEGRETIDVEEDPPVKVISPERRHSTGHHRTHSPSRRSSSRERRDHGRSRGRRSRSRGRRSRSRERRHRNGRSHKSPSRRKRSRSRDRRRSRSHSRDRRSRSRSKTRRSRSGSRSRGKKDRRHSRSRSRERHRRSRSRDRERRRRRPRRRRRRRRNRSRDRRMRQQRSASRSRSRSPQRKKNEPLSFKEKLKASLMEVQKKASEGKLSLEDLANSSGLAVNSEKPSNLPLNSSNPLHSMATGGGQVTPQQALLQTMAAMHQKAQELTGVAVPKYYNPAAVNPLKYAEQVQKRKLLWGKKDKDKPVEQPAGLPGPSSTAPVDPAAIAAAAGAAKPSMSSTWRGTHFNHDTKTEAKFRKLMGIKDDPAEPTEATESAEGQDVMKKQEEMFSRLDQEYEFARMATHTHRGIGLGFTSHVYNYQPKQ